MGLSRIRAELSGFDWHNLRNTESIGSWPPSARVIVLLVALLLFTASGNRLVVGALRAELALLADEAAALHQELAQKAPAAAELSLQQTSTDVEEEVLSQLLQRIPGARDADKSHVAQLVDDITRVGQDHHLLFTNVSPGAEQEQEYYLAQPLRMAVRGHYHDFASFLGAASRLPWLLTLQDFSIERGQGELHITATLQAHAQHSSPGSDPVPPLTATAAPAENTARSGATYTGSSLRSPFDPLADSLSAVPDDGTASEADILLEASPDIIPAGPVPDFARAVDPLEHFPLSSLHMV
ncbi:MAG: type 4a pilus biogenesis protein PilO, partial [Pseudomonas sp.]